ncbi:MAG: hypothetical protein JSR17_10300 [Proteobacteria bacterium]|nr:hypothetical protein [Pseudomonadota bacterium]
MAIKGAIKVESSQEAQLIEFIKRYYSNEKLEAHLEADKIQSILAQFTAIKEYAQETFTEHSLLTDEEMIILTLSIFSPHPSPEKAIVAKERSYMEVKRALSRFYCVEQLQRDEAGFAEFVACQQQDKKYIPGLNKEEYLEISKKFQAKDRLTIDTLKLATLISSVPLSAEAKKRADKIFGKGNYVVDSVEFPAKVFEDINLARQIYPQVDVFLNHLETEAQRQRVTKLLKSAFLHHCHYRHMLYTEGSKNMFTTFIKEVKAGRLDKEGYDFWVLYWTTNIAGFQGQVEPKGAYYLTLYTYKTMRALESVLESVFEDETVTEKDLLSAYLNKRASMLDLGNVQAMRLSLNLAEQLFLAHIGAMMRMYHPEQGQLLSAAYMMEKSVVDPLRREFFSPDESMPTPTYAPALFANAKDRIIERYEQEKVFLSTKRINVKSVNLTAQELKEMLATFEALILCLPLYLKALQEYKRLRREKLISADIPLSFQTIANQKWVEELFDKSIILDKVNILELIDITVSESGAVTYNKKPNYDDLLRAQQQREEADLFIDPKAPKPVLMSGFTSKPAVGASKLGEVSVVVQQPSDQQDRKVYK